MSKSFVPDTDAGLLAFASNFNAQITAIGGSIGLSPAMISQYGTLFTAYQTALAAAVEPSTRGGATILAKNLAKKPLVEDTRVLARIIQSNPSVTDEQRYDLGLPIHKDGPSPIPSPTSSPEIHVISTLGRTITVRLHSADAVKRGRPLNTTGATVMTYVGAAPSNNPQDWKFMGNFNKTVCELTFDAAVPNGATVWISAFWVGTKMASGPASAPIPVNLPGSVSMAA